MKEFRWGHEKNELLKRTRGVGFEQLVASKYVGITEHGVRGQNMLLFEYEEYVWLLPYVDAGDHYFLKTAYPSRKHTRMKSRGCYEKNRPVQD